jgi:hypothetical protein
LLTPNQVKAVLGKPKLPQCIGAFPEVDYTFIAERDEGFEQFAAISLVPGEVGGIVTVVLEKGKGSMR